MCDRLGALAGVEEVGRVKGGLDGPQQVELDLGLLAGQAAEQVLADAVLGADRAAQVPDEAVDLGGDGGDQVGGEPPAVLEGRQHVDVQVAVAEVAEREHDRLRPADPGGNGLDAALELGDPVDRDGGVELGPLRVDEDLGRELVPEQPEVGLLGGGLGHDGVGDPAAVGGRREEPGDRVGDRLAAAEPGHQVPLGPRVDRAGDAEDVDGGRHAHLGHQLEGGEPAGVDRAGQAVQVGGPVEAGECREQGAVVRQRRLEFEHGTGDHAERALGADEQLLEVVAGVVLAQGPQAVEDPAVGQHRLDAEDVAAGVAVPQDVEAAGVGGDRPADGGGAAGTPVHGQLPVDGGGGLLDLLDGATGLDGGGEPVGVDRLDPVQAGGEQQDRRAAVGQVVDRHRTAGEAGVAALGDHGGGVVGAGAHDGLNALDGVGPGDEHRRARVGLAPAGQHRAGVGRVQPAPRPEGVAQFGDEYVGHVRSPMGRRV